MVNPASLSPAAQAVFQAYLDNCDGAYEPEWYQGDLNMIAAALRAAADQAQASVYHASPSTDWGKGWEEGVKDATTGLLAIAAELDGTTTPSENV